MSNYDFCQPQLHILLQEHAQLHKKGVFHKNILELAFEGVGGFQKIYMIKNLKAFGIFGKFVSVKGKYFLPSTLSLYPTYEHTFQLSCLPSVFSWGEHILPQGFFFQLLLSLMDTWQTEVLDHL